MKNWLIIAALVAGMAHTPAVAQHLTLQSMAREFKTDALEAITPVASTDEYATISNDGRQIVKHSFNGGKQTAVLFDVDNTMGAKIEAFEGFILSEDGSKMLIQTKTEHIYRHSFKAEYYIYTVRSRKLEKLSDGGKQQIPQFSPDGNQVAFVRDNNIYLVKLLYDNAESQVTKDGKTNEIINGAPDWVNEEEFSFNSALCFNADGTKICWLRYDETDVPTYSLQVFKGLAPEQAAYADYPGEYTYKYPKAGQNNSKVTAWSYDIQSHRTQQLQVPTAESDYMPRIKPTTDPDKVIIYTLNRQQNILSLYAVNPSSTLSQMLIQEKADKYIPEDVVSTIMITRSAILVPSDRSGYTHLYIYNMNGQQIREVGNGNEIITAVYGYNDATEDAFYQVAPNPFDRYVAVSHRGGKTEVLSDKTGWNTAIFSSNNTYFMNTWSDMNTPFVVTTRNNKGKVLSTIYDNASLVSKQKSNNWNRREMFSFTTSEGVALNGWMVKPEGFSAGRKYPVIMYQYSGPGSQQVTNSWNCGSMGQGFDYYLAQQGYLVVCVDGRGTGGRGAEFEKVTYLRLGDLESKDQVEAASWLASQSYVDKDHIGIWGWSYGGFNTLMSMSEGRNVFACGVAVAPVTAWKYYDSIYTERFMRTPKENPEGYKIGPIYRADKLSGELLICHGTMDDNVHPQNTFEYTEALVQADKDYSEVLYTNRNHSIYGGNTRNHLMRQICNFFDENLKK